MKVFLSDLVFWDRSYEDTMEFLRENSVENLEFFIEPLDSESLAKVQKILDNYRFKEISFHGPFRKCNLAVMDEKEWENTVYSYEESFKIGGKYNPRYYVLHTNEGVDKTIPHLKEKISEKIEKLHKLAEKYGATLAVENVGLKEKNVFDQKDYEELILKNNYRALIDVGHAFVNGWDIEGLIERLGENIIGYHFHNNDGKEDWHRPIGEGDIDYKKICSAVKKYSPEAAIVLEYYFIHPADTAIKDMKRIEKL